MALYRVLRLGPPDIVELYRLHLAYVQLGLEELASLAERPTLEAGSPYLQRIEDFWSSLLPLDRSPRLRTALQTVSDQLALVRAAEPIVS